MKGRRWPWQTPQPGLEAVAALDADRTARTITITFADAAALERFWGWLAVNSCQAQGIKARLVKEGKR